MNMNFDRNNLIRDINRKTALFYLTNVMLNIDVMLLCIILNNHGYI